MGMGTAAADCNWQIGVYALQTTNTPGKVTTDIQPQVFQAANI